MENQDLIPEEEEFELEPELMKRVRQHKVLGIVVSLCMIVLGVLMAVLPQGGAIAVNYGLAIGILLMGIYELIAFFRTGAPFRNEMSLASGVILVLMGIVIVAMSLGDPASQLSMLIIFTVALGFLSLYRGIMQFFSHARFHKIDEKDNSWLLTSGVLNTVLGVLIVILPFTGLLAVGVVLGIYLAVAGVALLAEAVSGKVARKK